MPYMHIPGIFTANQKVDDKFWFLHCSSLHQFRVNHCIASMLEVRERNDSVTHGSVNMLLKIAAYALFQTDYKKINFTYFKYIDFRVIKIAITLTLNK